MHTLEEVAREALGVIPNLVTRHKFIVVQIYGTCVLIQVEKHKNRQVIGNEKIREKPREKSNWETERVTTATLE